ncbi:MAG: GNAT family N-acetyltransferase [Pseudobacter sp.]|uniref:GNAT family N-acetyltransferase n=1 Tax=Pseudobacter sp. TaxID=2045420 RepID=UPI003F7D65B2
MQEITIKKVTSSDLATLQSIGRKTFIDTFAQHNTEQNMITYLQQSFSDEKLSAELNTAGSEFYFAQIGDEVIGYLKINTGASQTELKNGNSLEVERIYVDQAYHGKKVGQLLYEWAMNIAQKRKYDFVWLGVWEHNARALRFYEKNGFIPFDKHVFMLGDDVQTDIMMKKNLEPAI